MKHVVWVTVEDRSGELFAVIRQKVSNEGHLMDTSISLDRYPLTDERSWERVLDYPQRADLVRKAKKAGEAREASTQRSMRMRSS